MLKSAFQHLQCHVTEHLSKQFVNILKKSVFAGETMSANGFIAHIRSILTEELEHLTDGQVGCFLFHWGTVANWWCSVPLVLVCWLSFISLGHGG